MKFVSRRIGVWRRRQNRDAGAVQQSRQVIGRPPRRNPERRRLLYVHQPVRQIRGHIYQLYCRGCRVRKWFRPLGLGKKPYTFRYLAASARVAPFKSLSPFLLRLRGKWSLACNNVSKTLLATKTAPTANANALHQAVNIWDRLGPFNPVSGSSDNKTDISWESRDVFSSLDDRVSSQSNFRS
jgi:hypothetical protein